MTTAIATPGPMASYQGKGIPDKYFASPQCFNQKAIENAFQMPGIDGQRDSSKTMDAAPSPSTDSPTALPFEHPASRPINGPRPPLAATPLPEPPHWTLHILTAWLTFGIIVAVVLYLAQFTPKSRWLQKLRGWRKGGYIEVKQNDHDQGSDNGRSSAVASSEHQDARWRLETSNVLRKRKPRGLTINVDAEFHGLGIAVSGGENDDRTPCKRRSYDSEALRLRPESPVKLAWESFTAPLPSIHAFVSDHQRSEQYQKTPYPHQPTSYADFDMESGVYAPHSWTATPDVFNIKSPLPIHSGNHRRGGEAETPGSAFFKKVNGRIHQAADRLSRTFYDQVKGPEEGLLLPVRERERELERARAVFVD